MDSLGRLEPDRKSGAEPFHRWGSNLSFDLLDFWRWSVSDLVSNATRGRLAEYVVARALGISTRGVRDEWAAFDLETPEGIKVEVKSAAYVQSWHQTSLSKISFSVKKSRAWNPDTNRLSTVPERQADVYVFALLAHLEKGTIDPLDLDQWEFFVLPTEVLNERKRSQHSITLRSLERMEAGPFDLAELRGAVLAAAGPSAST